MWAHISAFAEIFELISKKQPSVSPIKKNKQLEKIEK